MFGETTELFDRRQRVDINRRKRVVINRRQRVINYDYTFFVIIIRKTSKNGIYRCDDISFSIY